MYFPKSFSRFLLWAHTMGCLGVVALLWGFFFFALGIQNSKRPRQHSEKVLQGTVIFTGGKHRLLQSLQWFLQHPTPRLHVSGTDAYSMQRLKKRLNSAKLTSMLTYDSAKNTRENALFTKQWMRTYSLQQVVLLTSDYHLPRALHHLRGLGIPIEAVRVHGIQEKISLFKLFKEYLKYVLALLSSVVDKRVLLEYPVKNFRGKPYETPPSSGILSL